MGGGGASEQGHIEAGKGTGPDSGADVHQGGREMGPDRYRLMRSGAVWAGGARGQEMGTGLLVRRILQSHSSSNSSHNSSRTAPPNTQLPAPPDPAALTASRHAAKYAACGWQCVLDVAQQYREDLDFFGFEVPSKPVL